VAFAAILAVTDVLIVFFAELRWFDDVDVAESDAVGALC
jgi:hypothetical protein